MYLFILNHRDLVASATYLNQQLISHNMLLARTYYVDVAPD